MHLDTQTRTKLQNSANEVYLAYAKLDVCSLEKFSFQWLA
jgi:hypothetical protein